MAIEIVDFPMNNADFPWFFVCLPEANPVFVSHHLPGVFWLRLSAVDTLQVLALFGAKNLVALSEAIKCLVNDGNL